MVLRPEQTRARRGPGERSEMSLESSSKDCFKMWILLSLVFFLCPVKAVAGFKTTCTIPPVMPGSNASLTCKLTENVNQTRRNFIVFGPSEDISMKCWWNDTNLKCDTASTGYNYNFQVSDTLTIEVPQVFGLYGCKLNKRVFYEGCFLEEHSRLRLTCPTYPDDVITAPEGSEILVKLCIEGLDKVEEPYQFRLLILKNVTEDGLRYDYGFLCVFEYNHTTKTFDTSTQRKGCSSESGPSSSLMFTLTVSGQNNGQVISLESYRSGNITAPAKELLLNITETPEIVIDDRKTVVVSESEQVRLEYQVRTHTDKLSCQLRMSATLHEIVRRENTFTCFFVGQPPEINLTIVMNNISATDSGLWKLEIENELGIDSVEFLVHVRNDGTYVRTTTGREMRHSYIDLEIGG